MLTIVGRAAPIWNAVTTKSSRRLGAEDRAEGPERLPRHPSSSTPSSRAAMADSPLAAPQTARPDLLLARPWSQAERPERATTPSLIQSVICHEVDWRDGFTATTFQMPVPSRTTNAGHAM